jgi:hypothetical protein
MAAERSDPRLRARIELRRVVNPVRPRAGSGLDGRTRISTLAVVRVPVLDRRTSSVVQMGQTGQTWVKSFTDVREAPRAVRNQHSGQG